MQADNLTYGIWAYYTGQFKKVGGGGGRGLITSAHTCTEHIYVRPPMGTN